MPRRIWSSFAAFQKEHKNGVIMCVGEAGSKCAQRWAGHWFTALKDSVPPQTCISRYTAWHSSLLPSEIVLDILPEGQKGAFTKEDGEKVIDETGKWVM